MLSWRQLSVVAGLVTAVMILRRVQATREAPWYGSVALSGCAAQEML